MLQQIKSSSWEMKVEKHVNCESKQGSTHQVGDVGRLLAWLLPCRGRTESARKHGTRRHGQSHRCLARLVFDWPMMGELL